MGGKSSKSSKGGGKGGGGKKGSGGGGGGRGGAAASNQNNVRSSGRNGARPAWEKAKPGKNGGGRGSNSTVTNKLRDANDSWGVTTYNLLDLENGVGVDDNRNNDNGNRFGNFRDLTRDRNEEEGERRRQQYNERNTALKKQTSVSSSNFRRSPSPPKNFRRSPSPPRRNARRSPSPPPRRRNSNQRASPVKKNSGGNTRMVRNQANDRRFANSVPEGGGGRDRKNSDRRARSSSPPRRRSPPHHRVAPNNKGGSKNRNRNSKGRPSSMGAFTNLSNVKSATQSVDSQVSNFNSSSRVDKFNDKRDSLADAHLNKIQGLKNSFNDQRVTGVDSYDRAKKDMGSDEWEQEVKGVEMIVSIARQKPEILRGDIKHLIRLMIEELKNLRSQVCRAAGQAFGELYLNLGKSMETELEKQVTLLLQKAADTNKFIRESCNEALDVMCENVSVFRAVQTVLGGGANHKSVVVRTNVARILDNMVGALGAEKFMGSSRELQEMILQHFAQALSDPALDVRKHSKHAVSTLSRHSKFESTLRTHLRSDKDVDAVKKAVK